MKIRKPRNFQGILGVHCHEDICHVTFHGFIGGLGLEYAKDLHKWLGQAIKYMEQKKDREK